MKTQTNTARTLKADRRRMAVMLLIYAVAQVIFVWRGQIRSPFVSGSDDMIYIRFAESLAAFQTPDSLQYPLFYPLMMAPFTHLQGLFGYWPFLVVNILVKLISIVVTSRILRAWLPGEEADVTSFLIYLSPVAFDYSMRVMSENVFAPLLVIATLLHFRYRTCLREASSSVARRLLLTAAMAFTAWIFLRIRYLSIVLMPAFCLLWSTGALGEQERSAGGAKAGDAPGTKAKESSGTAGGNASENGKPDLQGQILRFFLYTVLYTAIVLALVAGRGALYAAQTNRAFTLELVKNTLGFNTASGPTMAGGLRLIPSKRWLLIYALYAGMGVSIPAAAMLRCASGRRLKTFGALAAASCAMALLFVYVSARHSTIAPYNEGRHMVRMLGRYVAPSTTLAVMLVPFLCEWRGRRTADDSAGGISLFRALAAFVPCALTVIAGWLVIYRNALHLDLGESFTSFNRALDLKAFLMHGVISTIVYVSCLAVISLYPKKWLYRITLAGCFIFQIVMAVK